LIIVGPASFLAIIDHVPRFTAETFFKAQVIAETFVLLYQIIVFKFLPQSKI